MISSVQKVFLKLVQVLTSIMLSPVLICFNLGITFTTSPVLKTIISDNVSKSPYIYLREIHSHELEPIVQFMYLGQTTVDYDRKDQFLHVAKRLKIKEIGTNNEEENNDNDKKDFEVINELQPFDALPQEITEKVKQVKKRGYNNLNRQRRAKNDIPPYLCDQCNLKFTRSFNLYKHIRIIHGGIKFPCVQCNFKASREDHLEQHIKSVHIGIKYPCNQCLYEAKYPQGLQQHIKAIHDGIRPFPCDQCNYKATKKTHLRYHIKSIHSGETMWYPCEQCIFKAKRLQTLQKHKNSFHGKYSKYPCDHCKREYTKVGNLLLHIKSMHSM